MPLFGLRWERVDRAPPARPRRRRRLASLIAVLAIAVLITSVATADIVLTYVSTTSVNTVATDWEFETGANYAAASDFTLTTVNGCAAGTAQGHCAANELTTTLDGVAGVGVEVLNVANLENTVALPDTAHVLSTGISLVNPAVKLPAGLTCAYAIISDALPTAGTTAIPAEAAACPATEPTLGALSGGCGGASTAGMTIVDLTDNYAPTVQTPAAWTCNMANGLAANTIELYVSFAIYATGAITGAPVTENTFGVQVTAP